MVSDNLKYCGLSAIKSRRFSLDAANQKTIGSGRLDESALLIRNPKEPAQHQVRSQSISRVLSRAAIPLGKPLPVYSSDLPENSASHAQVFCLVLLQMGFSLPDASPHPRCALTTPFHPYLYHHWSSAVSLSVPLSIASRRLAVSQHLALRSPDFPLLINNQTAAA